MKSVLYCFVTLSALGLVLSILSHVAALLKIGGPLGDHTWALHIGIFVVGLPTVFVSQHYKPPLMSYFRQDVPPDYVLEGSSPRLSEMDEISDLGLLWVCLSELSIYSCGGFQNWTVDESLRPMWAACYHSWKQVEIKRWYLSF